LYVFFWVIPPASEFYIQAYEDRTDTVFQNVGI